MLSLRALCGSSLSAWFSVSSVPQRRFFKGLNYCEGVVREAQINHQVILRKGTKVTKKRGNSCFHFVHIVHFVA